MGDVDDKLAAEGEAIDALRARIGQFVERAHVYLAAQRPQRVLIVDDDPAVARALARILDALTGVEVVAVGGFREGKAFLASDSRFGAALVDLNLGDGDGWTFVDQVLPRSIRPIIMSGALDAHSISELARATGAIAIAKPIDATGPVAIAKPIDATRLLELVQQELTR